MSPVIPPFALERPSSLSEAFAIFRDADGDACWYAGGTELLQVMKMGLVQYRTLIDLKGLPELGGISIGGDDALMIGATQTYRAIRQHPMVGRYLPALKVLAESLANVRVRNQGTLGGNLCFGEPHSDPATYLLACGAKVHLVGPGGERAVPLWSFIRGPFDTARLAEEIMVAVGVPAASPGTGDGYASVRFRERAAASVAVRLRVRAGSIERAAVAVGSIAATPILADDAAAALTGAPIDAESMVRAVDAGIETIGGLPAIDDLDGHADYKRHLGGVLLGRAVRAALEQATAGV
jgi:carbon-monoxide dehydrogenase medium subunit